MIQQEPPSSRRHAREQRDSAAVSNSSEETVTARGRKSSTNQRTDASQSMSRQRKRRRRAWAWSVVGLTGLTVIAGGAAIGMRLYDQAMEVRSHLEAAMVEVGDVQRSIVDGNRSSAVTAAADLAGHTAAAVSGTKGRLWAATEAVPVLGNNLTAVRVVAETTDALARDAVTPATALDLTALQPSEGRINLEALSALTPIVETIGAGLEDARTAIATIDRAGLIDQVAVGVDQLSAALDKVVPMIDPLSQALAILPNALGADGPRNYLLMFQGTSEARSLGGNAAVFIVLRAEAGHIEIVDQANSSDFIQPTADPVVPLDPEAVSIYGDKIGRYTPDFTMVPDLPAAAGILGGWWNRFKSTDYDSILSVDPVALAYILAATGPVSLPTGEVLDGGNAASLLLNEVYFRYEDPKVQNAFFIAAADAVFNMLFSGDFNPLALLPALEKGATQGRILYLGGNSLENETIAGMRMSGIMPVDDSKRPFLGLYINDNTGSKKSYYLDAEVSVCQTEAQLSGEVTLTSWLTASEAARLPYQITGPYFDPSTISTYVALYGPRGSALSAISIDGVPAQIESAGTHLGRPVVKVEVRNVLESAHTISYTFAGNFSGLEPVELWHTPLARETPVDVRLGCGE